MCGLFGYIGKQDPAKVCLAGLKHLEYRGYDSAGIAGICQGEILSCKEVGKIHSLEKTLIENPLPLELAIAHTRWATHGKPTKENAHPHFDESGSVAVIHNGIIENHTHLREMLREKGIKFSSDTDSEVIAQLISYYYRGDFFEAFQKALSHLKGFWGIAAIHKNHADQIIASAVQNPVAIGFHAEEKEAFVSSDANAFERSDLDVFFLKDKEVALIGKNGVDIFDTTSKRLQKEPQRLTVAANAISKNGFDHFMLKEIFEQAHTIQQAMHQRFNEEFGTAEFENFSFSASELLSVRRILILACGTSWHAGCIAASLLEDIARIPTQAEIASEYRYKNPIISEDTLVIAISQSGETLDTLAAIREIKAKGAKVLGICNQPNSTLTREADGMILLKAGPEICVCSTKAFTSQLTVLSLFTLLMARLRHMNKEDGQQFLQQLKELPLIVEKILRKEKEISLLAKKYAQFEHFFFLGRHYMFTTSLEGALKLKEISYLNAVGYPAGEMKHGPIALVNPDLAVVGMCGNLSTYEKMLSNLAEVKARGGVILAFAPEEAPEIDQIADDVLRLPYVSDALASIPYSIAAQLLAYYIAKERGTEIDQPRNLAKSVTVE